MRISLFLVLLLVAAPVFSAARTVPRGSEFFELWFLADITIAPDGSVAQQSWRNFTDMPEPALRDLEQRIATWRFAPAQVDGTPVETETSLIVLALAIKERRADRFRMEIAHAIVGPSLSAGRWPDEDFPEAMQSKRYSGTLVYDITFEPGKQPAIEFGRFLGNTENPNFQAAFEQRAAHVVEPWFVRHERVAGLPVTARFRHRVTWCSNYRWCRGEFGDVFAGLPEMPGWQPTPVNSVTRLLTDVATIRKPDWYTISTSNPLYPPFAPGK